MDTKSTVEVGSSKMYRRLVALCAVAAVSTWAGNLLAAIVEIAPGDGVATNVLSVFTGDTALSLNPGTSGGGIVTLNKGNSHTGGTSLGCGTLVVTNPGEGGRSPVGTGTFAPGPGTLRYAGPADATFRANVAPSFASGSTAACVFDVQNDLSFVGVWNQPYGGFIKTGPGTLSIAGDAASTNWFGAADLTGGTGVFTDALLAKKLVFNANGDAPANGFGPFSVVDGTFRIESGGNVFGTETSASAAQVGAWTTDDGTEKSAVLEIAGGDNTFVSYLVVGRQNGSATTGGDKVQTGVRVTGGTTKIKGRLVLGWNGNTTAYPSLDSRPFYEQTGGTVTLSENLQLGYTNTKGVQASVTMTGGTLNVNGKNVVSGFNATYTTNTIDVSGSANLVGANNFYVHNGSSNGAGNKLDINVHDGGTLGFVALYSNNNTTKTDLRVNGGVLRNDKSGSNASALTTWIGNGTETKRLTSFKVGPKGATFCSKNGNSSGVAQVYSPITAEPAGEGETAAGVTIANGRIAFYLPMDYEGPTTVKNGGFLYLSKAGELPASSAVTVEGGGMFRLMGTDKTVPSLTLGENATLGFGTPSEGANSSVLTVSGALVLPAYARISLYTKSDVTGDKKVDNATYSVLKVPVSYAAALRAVKWSCATLTDGKFATFAVTEAGDVATLSVTISDAPAVAELTTVAADTYAQVSGSLYVDHNIDLYGTLKVSQDVTGSSTGGKLTVRNGGVLDVSSGKIVPANASGNSFDLYLEDGGSVFVKNIQASGSTWDSDPYFHFNGGTIYPLYARIADGSDDGGYQMLLNYQKATIGEYGLTIDMSRCVRPADYTKWLRVSVQGKIDHDHDCAGADGGIVIRGGVDEKVVVMFGGRFSGSTLNGGIRVEDGTIVSPFAYALVDQTLTVEPGARLRPFFSSATAPASVQVGSLTLGKAGATKPVKLDASNVSKLLGSYVISNSVSVLSPVEFGTCANWSIDNDFAVGTFTTLVYKATYSVDPTLFRLFAEATAAGYALSAEEVTIVYGGDSDWKALVCTVSAPAANDLVVIGSGAYPASATVSSDASYGKIIVGGTYNGANDPVPGCDTSITIEGGDVTASGALYMGYNPGDGGTVETGPHQGFLTIGSGASLSVPVVYSAYRNPNENNNNPRYGSVITVNGGCLDVAGDVRFGNHISKSGDKLYSQLTVDHGGRVTIGGAFYLYYYNANLALTSIPGCLVLNDGEVDVTGVVDLSRNNKVNKKSNGADYDSILYHYGLCLNGGVLKAENIKMTHSGAIPKVCFNGGTFMPYGKDEANRTMENLNVVYVSEGGAVISTENMPAGEAYTIAQPMLTDPALSGAADGGLVKKGAGTLALTGANTFTGPVSVEEGTLVAANAGAISDKVALSDSAALDLSNNDVTLDSMTARGFVVNGGITVTNMLAVSEGSYLSVDGGLTIGSHTKVDFGVAPGEAPSRTWFPVAAAGGTISVPSRLRAVNGGAGISYANAYVADGVLYMRPASSMLVIIVR